MADLRVIVHGISITIDQSMRLFSLPWNTEVLFLTAPYKVHTVCCNAHAQLCLQHYLEANGKLLGLSGSDPRFGDFVTLYSKCNLKQKASFPPSGLDQFGSVRYVLERLFFVFPLPKVADATNRTALCHPDFSSPLC